MSIFQIIFMVNNADSKNTNQTRRDSITNIIIIKTELRRTDQAEESYDTDYIKYNTENENMDRIVLLYCIVKCSDAKNK